MDKIQIDKQNMCVDRNSDFGKQLDAFNKRIAETTDPNEKAFMQQLSSYTEAALVVEGILPENEAAAKIEQLVAQMNKSLDNNK